MWIKREKKRKEEKLISEISRRDGVKCEINKRREITLCDQLFKIWIQSTNYIGNSQFLRKFRSASIFFFFHILLNECSVEYLKIKILQSLIIIMQIKVYIHGLNNLNCLRFNNFCICFYKINLPRIPFHLCYSMIKVLHLSTKQLAAVINGHLFILM